MNSSLLKEFRLPEGFRLVKGSKLLKGVRILEEVRLHRDCLFLGLRIKSASMQVTLKYVTGTKSAVTCGHIPTIKISRGYYVIVPKLAMTNKFDVKRNRVITWALR